MSDDASAQDVDAFGRSQPDIPFPIFEYGSHQVARQAFPVRVHRVLLVLEPKQPTIGGAKPEIALTILEQAADLIGSRSLLGSQITEAAVRHAVEAAALSPDPEIAVAVPA